MLYIKRKMFSKEQNNIFNEYLYKENTAQKKIDFI